MLNNLKWCVKRWNILHLYGSTRLKTSFENDYIVRQYCRLWQENCVFPPLNLFSTLFFLPEKAFYTNIGIFLFLRWWKRNITTQMRIRKKWKRQERISHFFFFFVKRHASLNKLKVNELIHQTAATSLFLQHASNSHRQTSLSHNIAPAAKCISNLPIFAWKIPLQMTNFSLKIHDNPQSSS